jgi:hypothetical protein
LPAIRANLDLFSKIEILPRTSKLEALTPRSGTLASVPVDRLGKLMMTKSSDDASGPVVLRASPGASAIRRVSSRVRPLFISLSAPLRSTMATSFDPLEVSARLKPSAIASTPTSTSTTPAMPTAAVNAEPFRCGMVCRL